MRARLAPSILVLGLLAVWPVRARGQGPPSEGSFVLTLADALQRAARYHPAYRIARNDLDLSAPARRAAWAAFLPSLSVSGGTTLTLNRRRISEDFFGRPVKNAAPEWETTSSSSQGVRGGIVVFEGARRFHDLDVVGAEAESRAAAARSARLSVEAEVARSYLEAMRRRDLQELEEDLLGARRRDRERVELRYGLGGVGRRAVLTARERLVAQRVAVLRARAANEKARAALRRAVADPTLESFVLPPGPRGTTPLWDPDVEAVVVRALRANPEVRKERAAARAARARARATRGIRWPRVELGFEFTQNT
ncbi:MAG: TolC family protein, partial [Gemmatimonadetes bacterium]|nr:TolC family protein [Gemmatimonadota bacterium]NIV63570.1 TolC family protein [Gemmatimonadota bacterium]